MQRLRVLTVVVLIAATLLTLNNHLHIHTADHGTHAEHHSLLADGTSCHTHGTALIEVEWQLAVLALGLFLLGVLAFLAPLFENRFLFYPLFFASGGDRRVPARSPLEQLRSRLFHAPPAL
jgi:hypothetical protein